MRGKNLSLIIQHKIYEKKQLIYVKSTTPFPLHGKYSCIITEVHDSELLLH